MDYEGGQPGRKFVDIDLVQEHLQKATTHVVEHAGPIFRHGVEGALRFMNKPCYDSPLEVVFWIWWEAVVETSNRLGDYFGIVPQSEVMVGDEVFRVDFMVEPLEKEVATSPDWRPIAVELDGHAFHERTPAQVALRDRRDRALQAAGWQMFHFSFREFTAAPKNSVCEVLVAARAQRNRIMEKMGGQSTPSCFNA